MDHLGSLHIQVLSFGLLILVAHFMGKLTYHLNFGELIGQLLGGMRGHRDSARQNGCDGSGVVRIWAEAGRRRF